MLTTKKHYISEFEIQSYVFTNLTTILGEKFIVRAEVTYNGCRFDVAIFDAETRKLLCTIETKRRRGNRNDKWATVNQLSRYRMATGKPCILVTERNMESVVGAIRGRMAIDGAMNFSALG